MDATIDEARVGAFMERTLGDAAGLFTGVLAQLGDQLGLFRALAADGPATAAELAARAGIDERYALEWLRGMHAAGYVELLDGRFALPAEHAAVLAEEGGPYFMGGAFEVSFAYLQVIEPLTAAFRTGAGIPQDAYPPSTWHGMARFTRPFYDHRLVQQWVPAVDGLAGKLQRGARWADVGCGGGQAVRRLAEAFPNSTFVGYDQFAGQLALADASDRVRFEQLDVARGLPERYDVISAFDVLHDAEDPDALVRAIRDALEPDGVFVVLEMRSADDPAENVGPLATLLYGVSLLYCLSTSRAHGGGGLGTCGLPAGRLRELCLRGGFASLHEVPLEDPLNALYAVRP